MGVGAFVLVPDEGLEPSRLSTTHFECAASANSANPAWTCVWSGYRVVSLGETGEPVTRDHHSAAWRCRFFSASPNLQYQGISPGKAAKLGPVNDQSTAPSAPRRVVVAEDESLIRLDIVETLRDNGFDVVGEAGDGETAVRLVEELLPDVVVMDVKMPQLDGISAAERINKNHLAPVVLLTAFSQRELVERASEAGALAYVVKPFTPADLLPAIEIALSRFQQIVALESEVSDLAERFETRKLVDRAKGILNDKMGLSEPEAFRWIQKASMDRRLTMQDVAKTIIDQLGAKKD